MDSSAVLRARLGGLPQLLSLWQRYRAWQWLSLGTGILFSQMILACPIALFISDLSPVIEARRDALQVFVLDSADKNSWRRANIQVDPIDRDGRLQFFHDSKWRNEKLASSDRLVLEPESLGRQRQAGEQLPCRGELVYEIRNAIKPDSYGYLTNCRRGSDLGAVPLKRFADDQLQYDRVRKQITSDNYRYLFSDRNHMLFRQISIGPASLDHIVGENSELLIQADIKNFMKFRFDSTDIESYLEQVRVGEIGANARVSFFLKIFYFFTIKLALSTDVSFYKTSANIPMVIHIPTDADSHLHPGSGILYSWETGRTRQNYQESATMPQMTPELVKTIKGGHRVLGTLGKESCRGSTTCSFQLASTSKDGDFVMDFSIRRELVELGFFPIYVQDAAAFKDALDWSLPPAKNRRRVGFYFETSGLTEGSHPWDFWMRLGQQASPQHHCPHPVYITALKD